MAWGASVVAGSAGMAASHDPAWGPDWDRTSARASGVIAGSIRLSEMLVSSARRMKLPAMWPVAGASVLWRGRAGSLEDLSPAWAGFPTFCLQELAGLSSGAQTGGLRTAALQRIPIMLGKLGQTGADHADDHATSASPIRTTGK